MSAVTEVSTSRSNDLNVNLFLDLRGIRALLRSKHYLRLTQP